MIDMGIRHSKPTLTIFADASLYSDRRVVGWGGWARGDGRKPSFSSGPAPYHGCSGVAELWALALWIEEMRATGYLTENDRSIILQSDSLRALQQINASIANSWVSSKRTGDADIRRALKVKDDAQEPISRIADALSHARVIYLRHIRGHQGGDSARSWVNEKCDRLAKAAARQQFEGAQA